MKKFILLVALCGACSGNSPQEEGARMLQEARSALQRLEYDTARDTIFSLRKRFPTAIDARKQAILLLDSIELFAAQDSLENADSAEWERLSIKVQFFERKLIEDQKQ